MISHVQTTLGETPVQDFGSGNPLVVLHGGPGLDSSYLDGLRCLSHYRKLVFFNQLGCHAGFTGSFPPTLHDTISHAKQVIDSVAKKGTFGIIGHSWGALLTLLLYKNFPDFDPNEIIFINPSPLTWDRVKDMGKRMETALKNLLTKEEMAQRTRLAAVGTAEVGAEYMKVISPMYVGSRGDANKLRFGFYDPRIGAALFSELTGFDNRELAKKLPKRRLLVLGEKDFVTTNDVKELMTGTQIAIAKGLGHSPFVEDPPWFEQVVGSFLKKGLD